MKYYLDDTYEYDFLLIGISCHEKDYRISWALNQNLSLQLVKEKEDLEVFINKTNELSLHSIYTYKNAETHNEFILINNRSSAGFLIPEKQVADYLLIVKENFDFSSELFLKKIKNINFVLTAFKIPVEQLKSKENLIF